VAAEAIASARSQPVSSLATILVVAAMCVTVLLTAGRAIATEREVVASIDSASTRTIIFRMGPEANVDTGILHRLTSISGIEWAGAFSTAEDVRNSSLTGGAVVPFRDLWTTDLSPFNLTQYSMSVEIPESPRLSGSPTALKALGLRESAGEAIDGQDVVYSITGSLHTPLYLSSFEPLLISPHTIRHQDQRNAPVGVLVVVAERPQLVGTLRQVVSSLLAVEDPASMTVSVSEDLSDLRSAVSGQLRTFSRSLLAGVLAVAVFLVSVVLSGVVMLRRKDYGRRRALGASQGLIMALLATQTFLLGLAGAMLGTIVALSITVTVVDRLPSGDFLTAVVVLALGASLVAAVIPGAIAAKREPLRELRVP
jgi:putative ABC transport system permease protein